MRRSRSEPQSADEAAIVRNIASFLTLSDAVSSPGTDSWAIGEDFEDYSSVSELVTPPTPALVALSPDGGSFVNLRDDSSHASMHDMLARQRRKWAQEKLALAVLTHPRSLRTFCWEAYSAAQDIRQAKRENIPPEMMVEPPRKRPPWWILEEVVQLVFHNVPLSVLLDVTEACGKTSLDTSLATVHISFMSIDAMRSAVSTAAVMVWEAVVNFNPFQLLEAIISLQFNAMGRTSEVLVTGIQSVATGVSSASNLALHRLSGASLAIPHSQTSSSLRYSGESRSNQHAVLNDKLLHKLSSLNSAAKIVSYHEVPDDTGGLSKEGIGRMQRMMHYNVSLRPFVATVERPRASQPEGNAFLRQHAAGVPDSMLDLHDSSSSDSSANSNDLMTFNCTPRSVPTTPLSRQMYLARGSRFNDDVMFAVRDQLRLYSALDSEDERTREMARAMKEGDRHAVFDPRMTAAEVELSCGRHVATKVGQSLYCSTRSMVPVMRNCLVYFEMTVLPNPMGGSHVQMPMSTLSIGVSTAEMPSNTLVGAWQGSVGFYTTGQILQAGEWCSPADPAASSYVDGDTIGCLVYLDDDSAFETWDGVMVSASITFTVNGSVVPQPVTRLPMTGIDAVGMNPPKPPPESPHKSMVLSSSTLSVLVPAAEDLYPTTTLRSPGSSVLGRFSAEDILAPGPEALGLDDSVIVYCVDGSLLFSEESESSV